MHRSPKSFVTALLFGSIACAGALLVPATAHAEANLAGSWSGSGSVVLPSGATEKARCKASFSKAGGKSYNMNAVCATSSARVAQTASLSQTGTNRFSGEFTNSEYNVSGTITLTLSGNSLSASLRGGGASAFLTLGR